jgi:hypothetical protein
MIDVSTITCWNWSLISGVENQRSNEKEISHGRVSWQAHCSYSVDSGSFTTFTANVGAMTQSNQSMKPKTKLRVANRIASRSLRADAMETLPAVISLGFYLVVLC